METLQNQRQTVIEVLRARQRQPLTEAEKEANRAAIREARTLRDRLPSIAPDTTTDYIRQIREAPDAS